MQRKIYKPFKVDLLYFCTILIASNMVKYILRKFNKSKNQETNILTENTICMYLVFVHIYNIYLYFSAEKIHSSTKFSTEKFCTEKCLYRIFSMENIPYRKSDNHLPADSHSQHLPNFSVSLLAIQVPCDG